MPTNPQEQFPYPRYVWRRRFYQKLATFLFNILSDFTIVGAENFPKTGPLIVVANHFHFADPVAVLRVAPWPLEFLGGFHMPGAPAAIRWIPKLWGFYPVHRGAVSRTAFRATQAVMAQNGIMGIFPEAGSWATVLRPARPGTALLAVQTGAPILPIGLDGMPNVFDLFSQHRRPKVTVRVGKPFGPFTVNGRGKEKREELDAISEEIMRQIAALLPPEQHGVFSSDPVLREAAEAVAAYPYHELYKDGD